MSPIKIKKIKIFKVPPIHFFHEECSLILRKANIRPIKQESCVVIIRGMGGAGKPCVGETFSGIYLKIIIDNIIVIKEVANDIFEYFPSLFTFNRSSKGSSIYFLYRFPILLSNNSTL